MAPQLPDINPVRLKSSQMLMWNAKCSEWVTAMLEPWSKRCMITKMTKALTGMTVRQLVTRKVLKLMIPTVVFKQTWKTLYISSWEVDGEDSPFMADITLAKS